MKTDVMKQVAWLSLLCAAPAAYADGTINPQDQQLLTLHAGVANVQANEYVYYNSYKLSELNWDTRQAYMVGADLSQHIGKSKKLKLNISVDVAVNKASSTMDDYDWLIPGMDWSDWSHHDNTTLQKGQVVDVNLAKKVYSNRSGSLNMEMLFGYKQERWKWQAVGGSYIYSSNNGFRDMTGIFANIPGITYEQTVDTPYIGADLEWHSGGFSLGGKLVGSSFVTAKAVDHHHLRNLVFTDQFKDGKMFGADIRLNYHFSQNLGLGAEFAYQEYLHMRGDEFVEDQVTGQQGYASDSVGMSLSYQSLALNMTYLF